MATLTGDPFPDAPNYDPSPADDVAPAEAESPAQGGQGVGPGPTRDSRPAGIVGGHVTQEKLDERAAAEANAAGENAFKAAGGKKPPRFAADSPYRNRGDR